MSLDSIKMSKEQTRQINGKMCDFLMSQMQDEFERQKYLEERYLRSKELEEVRKEKDPTKMDIICAYEKYITDVATGYVIGKAPTYFNKYKEKVNKRKTIFGYEKENRIALQNDGVDLKEINDEFIDVLSEIRNNNRDQKENIRLTKTAFTRSKAYEIIYTNSDGEIKYKLLNGDCALIKSDDIESKTIGFIRRYKSKKLDFKGYQYYPEEITYIELYTHYKRVRYSSEDGYVKEENLWSGNIKPFEDDWEIPIVSIEMPDGLGLFEQQISEVRGYELVTNNTKKILNYNDDAILMISGVMFLNGESQEEINKVIERYRTQGVIFTGGDEDGGGASWLTKQVNDTTNQAHKDNLKNDIYGVTGLFNPENDSAVYQNTLSLVFKLYGLETKMSEFEEVFKDAMQRRAKIISQILNRTQNKNYDWRSVDLTMFRNLPTNTNEELNFVNQAKEILPLEKIYEELSFVTDAKEMVEMFEQDQIRQAKLEAKISKILSEETQNDMTSDNPYLQKQEVVENEQDDTEDDEEVLNEEE